MKPELGTIVSDCLLQCNTVKNRKTFLNEIAGDNMFGQNSSKENFHGVSKYSSLRHTTDAQLW
jgi:hypothetical protein